MFAHLFHRLVAVAACLRFTDQLMVAGVPLVAAAVFKLPADQVGAIIAAQGAAWLFMSLPAGVMIDRISPLQGVRRAMVIAFVGVCILTMGLVFNATVLFAFGAFVSATAAVFGFLAEGASVQRLLRGDDLGPGNARLQIIQSCAVLVGPLLVGWLIAGGLVLGVFLIAALLAITGVMLARGFPDQEPPPLRERAPVAEIKEGFNFVRQQPLLRGIVVCALSWNMAFMALAAIFVPFALQHLSMGAAEIGMAQSAMGMGSIAAALTASWAIRRLPPRVMLFFGPASSAVAAILLLLAAPAAELGIKGLFLAGTVYLILGFGPIIWFVCQNTIRQLVTPAGMLGRVGAVIQIAIYGVRSISALLAGKIAVIYGFEAVLWLIAGLFALSTLAIPLSALGGLSAMPRNACSQA